MRANRLFSTVITLISMTLLFGCGGGSGSSDSTSSDDPISEIPSSDFSSPGTAVLSWTPPTETTDNSTLTNLAGYNIYYGTVEGENEKRVVLNNPGLSAYVLENIPTGYEYYFTMTAFDSSGAESKRSNVETKTL